MEEKIDVESYKKYEKIQNYVEDQPSQNNTTKTTCTLSSVNQSLTSFKVNDFGFYESCLENKNLTYFLLRTNTSVSNFQTSIFLSVCAAINCSAPSIKALAAPLFYSEESEIGNIAVYNIREFAESFRAQHPSFATTALLCFMLILLLFSCISHCFARIAKKGILDIALAKKFSSLSQSLMSMDVIRNLAREETSKIFWSQFDFFANLDSAFSARWISPSAQAIDLIKSIFMMGIIFWHEVSLRVFYSRSFKDGDIGYLSWIQKDWGMTFVELTIFGISGFFMLSGYVSIITASKVINEAKQQQRGFLSIYAFLVFKRYWRVWPLMMIALLLFWKTLPGVISGPEMIEFVENDHCDFSGFLQSFPLVLFTFSDGYKPCGEWLWYLQCDMRIYLTVPILAYISRTRSTGMAITAVIVVCASIYTYFTCIEEGIFYGTHDFVKFFSSATSHLSSYFVGAFAAYLIHKKRKKEKKKKLDVVTTLRKGSFNPVSSAPTNQRKSRRRNSAHSLGSGGSPTGNRRGSMEADKKQLTFLELDTPSFVSMSDFGANMEETYERHMHRQRRQRRVMIIRKCFAILMFYTFMMLILLYHFYFQVPRPDNEIQENALFVTLSPLVYPGVFILGIIQAFRSSRSLWNGVRYSRIFQSLSNMVLSAYMIQSVVIVSRNYSIRSFDSNYLIDFFGSFLCDLAYTYLLGLLLTVLVDIPVKNCWGAFVENRFMKRRLGFADEDDELSLDGDSSFISDNGMDFV